MKQALLRRVQVLLFTLGGLVRAPGGTALTVAVIGISLALPAGLYVGLSGLSRVASHWHPGTDIVVYLRPNLSDADAERLAQSWRGKTGVAHVRLISRAQGLADFKTYSGLGDALGALDRNPLPAVVIVRPADTRAASLEDWSRRLKRAQDVDAVQLDLTWVQRLHALIALGERGVLLLAAALALAVVLIVSNTIRLAVLNRRPEIEVLKLIGATPGFIRRPFVYAGVIQGAVGGLTAWILVAAGLLVLSGPLARLAAAYGSSVTLHVASPLLLGALLILGGGLGWAGARFAVGRHLKEIEPG